MLNSVKAKPKSSKLEKIMNRQVLTVFIVQLMLCVFSSLYSAFWYLANKKELPYLEIDPNGIKDNSFAYNFFVRFGNWLLIFTLDIFFFR